jgi:hypothetical protein
MSRFTLPPRRQAGRAGKSRETDRDRDRDRDREMAKRKKLLDGWMDERTNE